MTLVLTSPEDLVNAALEEIGYPNRVGHMYEGSEASKVALDLYGQTRDAMLRESDWEFARFDVALTLLKSAPADYVGLTWSNTYPPLPWKYAYMWPTNCLKVRSLRKTPAYIPNFDIQPVPFNTPIDTASSMKVICCNISNAIGVYTGQITDMTQWEASFMDAFIATLGKRMAPRLNSQAVAVMAPEAQADMATAEMTKG